MVEALKKAEAEKPNGEREQAATDAQNEVNELAEKAKLALIEFEKLDQKQVDHIVAKASVAALNKHLVLAKMAVDETGRGLVEDKATKKYIFMRTYYALLSRTAYSRNYSRRRCSWN